MRLFPGMTAEGRYFYAMVGGDVASYFERVVRDVSIVDAEVRLAAIFDDKERIMPLLVIDKCQPVSEAAR